MITVDVRRWQLKTPKNAPQKYVTKTRIGNCGEEEADGFWPDRRALRNAMDFEMAFVRVLVITVVIPAPETFITSAAALCRPMAKEIARRCLMGNGPD